MSLTTPIPDSIIDLSHERCPNVLVKTIAAMRALEDGQILQIVATDVSASSHITNWARQSGQNLLEMYREGDRFVFFLERFREPAGQRGASTLKRRKAL